MLVLLHMVLSRRGEALILLLGDIIIFLFSLWMTLGLRHLDFPSWELFTKHLLPFTLMFLFWVLVFYISGLYEKHTLILKHRLPRTIFNAQTMNALLGIAFFYLIPYFHITPKTVLFIYLAISFLFILLWRLFGHNIFRPRVRENAILIGSGEEINEIKSEVNNNNRYQMYFISSVNLSKLEGVDLQEEIISRVYSERVGVIAVDLRHEQVDQLLPHLYNLIFSNIRFVDTHKLYEDIFDRIPLSLVRYNWFLENISVSFRKPYDPLKRLMDVILSAVGCVFTALVIPFVWIALKIEDNGPLFSRQTRVGRNNRPVELLKFRTMTNANDGGEWDKVPNKVTKVGAFLRRSRIDELPQLWNVLKGQVSLIGPRPEFPKAVKAYADQISFYNIRHLIKPGLSGWAQIKNDENPHHGVGVNETRAKLSHDLYYMKNRSLMLDLKIALMTVNEFMRRAGR